MACCAYSCTQYGLHTQYMLLTHDDDLLCLQLHTVRSAYTVHASDPCWWLAVPTAAHSTFSIHSTCFWPMMMTSCAYSCTQYGLHTQYMLLTHADDLLCLQLHTVRSAYTVHGFWPMLMTCCTYSCTQYGLHTQYMLLTHSDDLLCLQLHTVRSAYTIHASDPCRWLAVPTAAHSTVCTHSTCF